MQNKFIKVVKLGKKKRDYVKSTLQRIYESRAKFSKNKVDKKKSKSKKHTRAKSSLFDSKLQGGMNDTDFLEFRKFTNLEDAVSKNSDYHVMDLNCEKIERENMM